MNLSPMEAGLIGCVVLVVLLFSSMPVGFAMAAAGVVGLALMKSFAVAGETQAKDVYGVLSSESLTVIPLFVLMGQVAFHAGISRRLFRAAYAWIGHLPGGLAMATVGACTAFGAICGSGPATSATMAMVALPEMKRYKYDMSLATGTVASGGTLGMMIPPSVVFIVYGILTMQSIGALFISGIIPGLLTALIFCLTIYGMCVRNPRLGPAGAKVSWSERLLSLGGTGETLVLFALVMGGMFAGFFTPTEGAGIGAGATILIALLRRQITHKALLRATYETVRTSCMVLIIVAGATTFGHLLADSQITTRLADWLSHLPLPAWGIMSFIILFYLIGGCFVDALALLLLTVPIFYPVVQQPAFEAMGYTPIWFGVIIVLATQMGTITPPVGVCAYVVGGIERDVPLQTVFKGCTPFLLGLAAATILLMIWPQLATWLPSLSHAAP